ncbi:MAG TPA: sugar phosphate isomerase/epimerase family protein [Tepidisphaeraceae bacterium]|nr:sugar phosphate isomerase/epimerase family protein [Tepidisphaeraceae bacterium]
MERRNRIAVRDQIIPVGAGQSLFDALQILGVNAIEVLVDINCFVPYLRTADAAAMSVADDGSIAETKRRLDDAQVRVAALLVASDLAGDNAAAHVAWAIQVARAAGALGAPVVRIDTWTAKQSLSAEQVCQNLIERLTELLERTADTGVELGIENHGPFSNDEQFLDRILEAIPDPRLGLTLDTGNFYWWGHPLADVYRLIEKYAPRTKHTHVKNINYPPGLAKQKRPIGHEYKEFCSPLGEGNIDLRRVVQLLESGGYLRDYCIEDESLFRFPEEGRLGVLRRDVQAMSRALEAPGG